MAYTVLSTAQPAPPAHSCSTDLKKNHEIDLAPDARPPEATGNQRSVGLRHSVVSWWQAALMWAHGVVGTPSQRVIGSSRWIFWMGSRTCSSPTLVLKERIHLDHHEPGVTWTHQRPPSPKLSTGASFQQEEPGWGLPMGLLRVVPAGAGEARQKCLNAFWRMDSSAAGELAAPPDRAVCRPRSRARNEGSHSLTLPYDLAGLVCGRRQ